MLYKNNKSVKPDMELFKNPTSEYRGAPFWAWNCDLEEKELMWQIEQLKSMGFGGFHMHTRSGMSTRYLSEAFMNLIKSCTKKAKEQGMLAWLYDEDRWPSGAAGGYVTKTPKFRERRLIFTKHRQSVADSKETAKENGTTYLVGIYDIVLNHKGELSEYRMIKSEDKAKGEVRYAYDEVYSPMRSPGWFNGGTYVNTLCKPAMEKFVEITYESYKNAVGGEFGRTVPAIFTDEPQFNRYKNLPFSGSRDDASIPWTYDIDETFQKAYGYDIKEHLPELFWELPDEKVSAVRYHFHNHVSDRFSEAFFGTLGNWCQKNGIALTGHLHDEPTLLSQSKTIGDAMRHYRFFHLPGIDMLANRREYTTAKQAQSAVHQYGREGLMSELYGVTNWDFDFRGHKFQGDWQAALGVTARVHHLAWVSMKGSAKRDYPASINYQSPWYKEYPYIEDHFARLNTVLTRGKPVVKVGVIHPIESYWLHYGPEDSTSMIRNELDEKFENITKWLLFGTVDFDFICEATLPQLYRETNGSLAVGEMEYSTVIVPACHTLRGSTVDILYRFAKQGGRVIFAGEAPKLVDAQPSRFIKHLLEHSVKIPFERYAIIKELEDERTIEIKDISGKDSQSFIYQMRKDGDAFSLFIANANPVSENMHNLGSELPFKALIKINGEFHPTVMNTLTGETEAVDFKAENGTTEIHYDFYENDSLLLYLKPSSEGSYTLPELQKEILETIDFKHSVGYIRHEDNVCIIDMSEFALDGGDFEETEEILRLDKKLREKFGWPLATGQDMQPWAMEREKTSHYVTLRFTVNCKDSLENTYLCAEDCVSLMLNGEDVSLKQSGYFVDKAIKKYPLPPLLAGKNIIIAKFPFSKHQSLEASYLTGDFDAALSGCEKTLATPKGTIAFGDITSQGMPFYGGNITYTQKVNLPEDCSICVNIANYRGALTKLKIDGKDAGNIVFAPYELHVKNLTAGEHEMEFILFGNRHNTFGGLHNCGKSNYYGQKYWYSYDNSWSYEYNLKKTGILKSPVITVYKAK